MRFRNWDDVREEAIESGDLALVSMGDLRDLTGHLRIGKNVLAQIEEELEARGIGHFPSDLPIRQDHRVYIYRMGSEAGTLLQAMERRDEKGIDVIQFFLGVEREPEEEVEELRQKAAQVDRIQQLLQSA